MFSSQTKVELKITKRMKVSYEYLDLICHKEDTRICGVVINDTDANTNGYNYVVWEAKFGTRIDNWWKDGDLKLNDDENIMFAILI